MYDYDYIPDICYDSTIGSSGFLDLYMPKGRPCPPAILYFHGGGLENGDRTCERAVYEYSARNGVAVIAADYRMYPAAKYPDFIVDAAKAACWAKRNAGQYGLGDLYIGGSSAGSYLTMMLFFDPAYLAAHGLKFTDFAGFLFDAGQPTVHYNVLRERGEDTRLVHIDAAAPIFHITADYDAASFLPKVQLLAADDDIPCRLEQNLLLQADMLNFGYPKGRIRMRIMKGYSHCGYVGEFQGEKSVLGEMIMSLTENWDSTAQ